MKSQDDELGYRVNFQLLHDVGAVMVNRPLADSEGIADLLAGMTLDEEVYHLPFTVRQAASTR